MLGLTMEEGAVAEWLKREGEEVRKDEPLFTVEMDKGIVEVPSPVAGVLQRVLVPVGQTVPVKTVLAEIAVAGEAPPAEPSAEPAGDAGAASAAVERPSRPLPSALPEREGTHRFASPRARMRARERGVSLEGLTGSGPRGRIVEADVLAAAPTRLAATPLARRLAAEHGIELGAIQGSGPGGRVTQEDVERALQPEEAEEVVALSRIRRITAERMAASARSVARVTLQLEADLTEAARFRAQLAPEFERLGVTKLPWDAILARAAGLALVEHPAVNSQWVEGRGIRRNAAAHVGVAVALEPEGLVVPVLRDAHQRSLRQLAGELLALVDKARAGRLSPADMEGGTFTITNLGAYRIDGFTPIINPPETAILGVGRIAEKPAVIDHQVEVRLMCSLSLSFDHRVVDGVPAAAFLSRLAELLERPYALLEI
jgi:pyruvate dehydrogenase E2 component (dihydrolipoamide acetyltransferase)